MSFLDDFLNIQSSWDSDSDTIRSGEDLQSHPLKYYSDEEDEDEDELKSILKTRLEKTKVSGNRSAEAIGGEENFGQQPPKRKEGRTGNVESLAVGDVFYDGEWYALVLGKDFKNFSENPVVLLAEGFESFKDDDKNIEGFPFNRFSVSETIYVTSFDRPLTAKTIQYFLFHYSNKKGWSRDLKDHFHRRLDSYRDRFTIFLRLWDSEPAESSKVRKPGRIDLSHWENK